MEQPLKLKNSIISIAVYYLGQIIKETVSSVNSYVQNLWDDDDDDDEEDRPEWKRRKRKK